LIQVLVGQVVDQCGAPDGIIAFDPRSFPKRGTHSVGVKRQWRGHRGKSEVDMDEYYADALAWRTWGFIIPEGVNRRF
jgi:hypothetical protein